MLEKECKYRKGYIKSKHSGLHKRDHIRKRAREVISKFREIKKGGKVPGGINVEFIRNLGDDVDWNALGLNYSNKDHRIIAEILRIKDHDKDEKVCLVTADLNLELQAENYNIKVIYPPDEWLLKIKDPRDEKLAKLEKIIPKIRLSFYDEIGESRKEILEISKRSNDIDLLSHDNIEDLVSQIREYVKSEIAGKKFDLFASQNHIEIYKNKMGDYPNQYRDYLYNQNVFHAWKSYAIKIILCLENVGNLPAEDLDIWIIFPPDLEVLEEIPEDPKEPPEPMPPRDIFDPIYGNELNISPPDLSDFFRNQRGISGPDIQVSSDNVSVHYWRIRLKQGLGWPLPLFIKFKSNDKAHSFDIKYSIKIGNMPMEQKGTLIISMK